MRQKSRRFFDRTKKNLNIFDFAIVAPFFLMWQANAGGFGLVAFDGSFGPLAWLPCPFTKILDAFAPAQRRATIFPHRLHMRRSGSACPVLKIARFRQGNGQR
jgi:hypothetical protein